MSVKEFEKKFGLTASIDEEKLRFVNRIENSIFKHLRNDYQSTFYRQVFEQTCYELGLNPIDYYQLPGILPNLSVLTKKDFIQTLKVIVALYKVLAAKPNTLRFIDSYVIDALERATINLSVNWKDGIFYPSGDDFLDKELIDTSLSLLDKYPNEKKDLKTALDNYYSKSLYGVVENCFIAVEGISRELLCNKKTLDNNKDELLRLLQFSKFWDKIFVNYLGYAHEYRRHAGENRHDLKPAEVEGFLYLTCLIIRAALKINDN